MGKILFIGKEVALLVFGMALTAASAVGLDMLVKHKKNSGKDHCLQSSVLNDFGTVTPGRKVVVNSLNRVTDHSGIPINKVEDLFEGFVEKNGTAIERLYEVYRKYGDDETVYLKPYNEAASQMVGRDKVFEVKFTGGKFEIKELAKVPAGYAMSCDDMEKYKGINKTVEDAINGNFVLNVHK